MKKSSAAVALGRRGGLTGVMRHLLERFRDGRIAVEDFTKLKHWLESDVEVPDGPWFKRFPKFILTGEGDLPKTFLTSKMIPHGREVF